MSGVWGMRKIEPEQARADTDKHNLEIIRSDPLLQRILTRYRCMSDEQRARLERLMELVEELK